MLAQMRVMLRLLALVAVVLALAGCRTDLYTNVSEREANEMMSALMSEGIMARKVAGRDNLFTVAVDNADVSTALAILDSKGLPRRDRSSIGQVFARSGIVSSPFEERVRYIYALGEEVAQTIQQIDGVLVARVHVVMPEEPGLGQTARPSSAAVFIKQRAGHDLEFLTPQIRRLVSNSIEGVDFEAVTVVLVEAVPPTIANGNGSDLVQVLPGLALHNASVGTFWSWLAGLGALLTTLVLLSAYLGWRLMRAGRGPQPDGDEDMA